MKLLLTSGGVRNESIQDALVGLLGRPIEECDALFVPTAAWGHPMVGPGTPWQKVTGWHLSPMCELGWKSLGILELTALPSLDRERWVPVLERADALLVSGGDALYLAHWMRESGVVDLLPSSEKLVYVGVSAGSMVMTPRIGREFVNWRPPTGGDETLGLVDFSIFPHLNNEHMPENRIPVARAWASRLTTPAYALDDQSAIVVDGSTVRVVSEGEWERLTPDASRAEYRG